MSKAQAPLQLALQRAGQVPERILCSTALRTRQTLDIATEAAGWNAAVAYSDRIYEAAAAQLLEVVREAPDDVQPPVEEDTSDGEDLTLPIIVLSLGLVLVVGAVLLWFFYRKKDKGQKGLGYRHERF